MLFQDGTYEAVCKDGNLYQRGTSERLSLALRLEIDGKEIKGDIHIELNDGTISDRALKTIRECFPAWDGTIEALDSGICLRDIPLSVVIENEESIKGEKDANGDIKVYSKVKWINPPGGGGYRPEMPTKADSKTLTAKYGAKFRALSGGTPPAAKKPAPAAKKAGPPAKKIAPSTVEACWEKMKAVNPGHMEDQLQEPWFGFIELVAPGKTSDTMTPEEFGKLLVHIDGNKL